MVIDMGYWTKVIKKLLILIFSVIAVLLGFRLAAYYIPFLIAFIISLLIEPLIRYIVKKTNINRKTSAILVMLIIFSVLIGLITWVAISMVTESSNLLQSLNIYIEKISIKIDEIMKGLDFNRLEIPAQVVGVLENSAGEFLNLITNWITSFLTSIVQGITSIPVIAIYVIITILSTYFICADKMYILDQLEHHFPRLWVKRFGIHLREIITSLGNYLKAEMILVFISFVIVLIGLYLFKFMGMNIQYPLLISVGIGFVDALPILGSGTIMMPWAITAALNGDIKLSVCLVILYAIILIARQIIEPKVVSSKIGIHPIFTLIAMYTGFRLMGIFRNVYRTSHVDYH